MGDMPEARGPGVPGRRPTRGGRGALLATLAGLCLLVACGGSEPAPEARPAAEASEAYDRYTLRGRLTEPPTAAEGGWRLTIQHEAIDDFRFEGEVVGMASMTMTFLAGDDIDPEGLATGSPLEFDWDVPRDPGSVGVISRLVALPSDTELALE